MGNGTQRRVRGIWRAWRIQRMRSSMGRSRQTSQTRQLLSQELEDQRISHAPGGGAEGVGGVGSWQERCTSPEMGAHLVCQREGLPDSWSQEGVLLSEMGMERPTTRDLFSTVTLGQPGATAGSWAEQSTCHTCLNWHSGCCAETRQGQKLEGQEEASTIQARGEDQRGSHRCQEKWLTSGYLIH